MGKLIKRTENKGLTKRQSRKAVQTIASLQTSKTLTQAAERLGISRSALYDRIEHYELGYIIQQLKKEAETTIIVSAPSIAEDLVKVAQGDKQVKAVELEAKKDILDRAGITKKEPQTQVNIASQDMNIEFIQS